MKINCPRCEGLPDFNIDWSRWPDDGTCHGCGSLKADVFMARLEAGTVRLDPTDKNYKVYVHNDGGELFKQTFRTDNIPIRTKEAAANARILRCSHDFTGLQIVKCIHCGITSRELSEISDDDRADATAQEAGEPLDPMKNWKFDMRDQTQTKFYFQHLSQEQMKRFVELLNEKKIKLNEPGFFYRRPFFIVEEKTDVQKAAERGFHS